jgi:hypothetical protein
MANLDRVFYQARITHGGDGWEKVSKFTKKKLVGSGRDYFKGKIWL